MASTRRERIYIVPRWAGLLLGATTFALLLMSTLGLVPSLDHPLPPTLGIALLVAGLAALIQSNENLRGIEVTAVSVPPAAAGEEARLDLTIHNGGSREHTGLEIRLGQSFRTAWFGRQQALTALSILRPNQAISVHLPLPAARRGRHAIPELWVTSIMPAGLCFAWKRFPAERHYYVYPRPRGLPIDRITSPGDLAGRSAAEDGEDVSGHRPYEPGDSLSRMDWRVFARTGKVVVRTLEGGLGAEVVLRWEDTHFLADPEARLEQLSCWVDQCLREAQPFRLVLPRETGDLTHLNHRACLEALATFAPDQP